MAQSFSVSDITIGRLGNVISYDNMGNMIFSDRFVPSVRLVDLLNGGSGSGSQSVTREVNVSDWTFYRHDDIYSRDFWKICINYDAAYCNTIVGFGILVADQSKVQIHTQLITSPGATEIIEFDDVAIFSNKIEIISSSKVHCYVNIEYI